MNELERWTDALTESLKKEEFVKLTLSKPVGSSDLLNVYGKLVLLKNVPQLSLTYHHQTKDIVKNFGLEEGVGLMHNLLTNEFKIGNLFTTKEDLILRISKKGKMDLSRGKASNMDVPEKTHDKQKQKRAGTSDNYLRQLGVTDEAGQVIPKMADKFKQINKYLEVMEALIKSAELKDKVHIVDMGAGKGYLTFALYDYLKNKLNLDAIVVGVEQRKDLVDKCNEIARACGFNNLSFVCNTIEEFAVPDVDILIALHACDTATDDAIAAGIKANASLIVCAPCCHKQIRQQLKGKAHDNPMLKYGIYKEREFEMVTDTIRALILEKNQYSSNIFEFISNEHTRKNTMLVGVKSKQKLDQTSAQHKIDSLKKEYQIEQHYLEGLT